MGFALLTIAMAALGSLPSVETSAQPAEAGPGLVVLDLGDAWAPRLFSETPALPQLYRGTFIALANERAGAYELYGIFPSIGVIRGRLLDEARHACHAAVDDRPLRGLKRTLTPWDAAATASARASTAAALADVQGHLRCEGLLPARARPGSFDPLTRDGLAAYQRRQMLPSSAVLDVETRETLLTASRELDFRTLLRALRERVVDATGLIEDGSARNAWEPILGRRIDAADYRRPLRPAPLEGGSPDLVARATEAAATALGWTSPEAAARALHEAPPARVAVPVPPVPAYHVKPMRLRAEIDRGDVWREYPLDGEGRPRPSPVRNRPTLTLYAVTEGGEIPLVRWPTTIGAWQPEQDEDGDVVTRYKASPTGRRYWRDLLVAPAWFPPPTTPDRELVRRGPDGAWEARADAVGPGYRSAYGLIALLHHRAAVGRDGSTLLADLEIRTHGSGNYRSVLRGSSHGCHRLFNHLALRLGSFLLAHQDFARHGLVEGRYGRVVHWKGHRFALRAVARGYRYELLPPVPVDVLPGRTVRSRPSATRSSPEPYEGGDHRHAQQEAEGAAAPGARPGQGP